MKIQYDEFLNTIWVKVCVTRIFYSIMNDAYDYVMDFFLKIKECKKVFNYVVFFTYTFYTSIVIQYIQFRILLYFSSFYNFFFFLRIKKSIHLLLRILFHFWYCIECVNWYQYVQNISALLTEIQQKIFSSISTKDKIIITHKT